MWVDRYAPTVQEQLAVHKKKVVEVSDWFDKSFQVLQW